MSRPARNLTGSLVETLTEEISSERYAPGDKLPTEHEMIARYGVSRTVVREAVAALKAEGLVQSRQGAGVFVAADASRRPFRLDPDGLQTLQGVLDVMELRMAVEIEAAGLAAERRTKRDLAAIEASLLAFEESAAPDDEAIEADYDFHLAISRATGNDTFATFIEFLGQRIIPRRSVHILQQIAAVRLGYLDKVLKEHRAIARAIERQDVQGARRAMRQHLQGGRDRYLKLARR